MSVSAPEPASLGHCSHPARKTLAWQRRSDAKSESMEQMDNAGKRMAFRIVEMLNFPEPMSETAQ
jgi:hypothetical protein